MARFRLRPLRRAFTPRAHDAPPVHFHSGPEGRPAVCFDSACIRPHLDVR